MANLVFKLIRFLVILTTLLFHYIGFAQYEIPDVPKFQTSVYDYANVLSASEKQLLEDKLVHFSDSTTTQIVIITIESLKGEDIGILTPKWGQEWGIGGTEKNDNGVIILLAKDERKIWISPGYGLEQYLSAGITGEIVRDVIIPEFKSGSYFNGLDKGTTAIFEVIKGTYKGTRKQNKGSGIPIIFIVIFFIVLIIIISKNKGNGNNNGTGGFGGPNIMDVIILSSLGRGGGSGFGGSSGGSFGGGGFGGGFGGGGFSGGGAGGSW
jgi:uncharacterized protein